MIDKCLIFYLTHQISNDIHRQCVRALFGNIKFICTSFRIRRAFLYYFAASANEFCISWQCMYIVVILQCKKTKTIAKLLKRAPKQASFKSYIDYFIAYTVTVSYRCSTFIRYKKSYNLVCDRIYNKIVSSQCNLTAQIEQMQDW